MQKPRSKDSQGNWFLLIGCPGVLDNPVHLIKQSLFLQVLRKHHSHVNEQLGYILSGEVEITIGDEKKICRVGDVYLIPSNISHGFKVLSQEGVEYIELFSPPKNENKEWYEAK